MSWNFLGGYLSISCICCFSYYLLHYISLLKNRWDTGASNERMNERCRYSIAKQRNKATPGQANQRARSGQCNPELRAKRKPSEQKAEKKNRQTTVTNDLYIMGGQHRPWAQVVQVLHRSHVAGHQAHQAGASSSDTGRPGELCNINQRASSITVKDKSFDIRCGLWW